MDTKDVLEPVPENNLPTETETEKKDAPASVPEEPSLEVRKGQNSNNIEPWMLQQNINLRPQRPMVWPMPSRMHYRFQDEEETEDEDVGLPAESRLIPLFSDLDNWENEIYEIDLLRAGNNKNARLYWIFYCNIVVSSNFCRRVVQKRHH
jgi:hypothetical protein